MDEFCVEILMDIPRIGVFDSGSLGIEVSQRVSQLMLQIDDVRCIDVCNF